MTYVSRLKECPRHTDDGLGSARSTMTSALVCSRVFMESSSILKPHITLGKGPGTAPEALSATSLLPPGVGQDDQLYLPSAPGTPKSGAPPLSWI